VASILAEAWRDEGACPHVAEPKAPELVWGAGREELALKVDAWASQAKDKRGHALRKDGLCMVAGVISLPREMEGEWGRFEKKAVAWLRKEYGKALVSVIKHNDEEHPHLHFYVVPELKKDFASIHRGYAAQSAATEDRGKRNLSADEAKRIRGEGKKAYGKAMQEWQQGLYEGVGRPLGLTRLGPRRQRLSRAQWKAREAEARAQAERDLALEEAEAKVAEEGRRFAERFLSEATRRKEHDDQVAAAAEARIAAAEAKIGAVEAEAAKVAQQWRGFVKRILPNVTDPKTRAEIAQAAGIRPEREGPGITR